MRILCLWLIPRQRVAEPPEVDRDRTAAELEEFSPRIGWHDWGGRWCFCLDVTSTSRWFGGEAALLERLQSWCDERCYAASAAIAESLGAAWAIVHFTPAEASTAFFAYIVPADRTLEELAPLPVEALRLDGKVTSVLIELGVTEIGPLYHLPREALAERFEPHLLDRLDQASGVVGELFTPYRPKPQYHAERLWEYGVTSADPLESVWKGLLPNLLVPLSAGNRGVARLLAELCGETGSLCRLVIGLLRPSLDREHLLGLLRLRLESVRLREPVVGTRLSVLEAAPPTVQQQVLFAELSPPTESAAWTTLVERLSGRLGSDRVVAVRPHSDHDPARAWRAAPWITKPDRRRPMPLKSVAKLPPRPTRLLPQPRPIRVLSLAPQGHPQGFDDRGEEARVVRCWGPERIETGWWRGPSLRRDYFCVETESGSHAWLFRDLRTRRWFLHGWFD
jgi:protein ImuB